jgi:hypothetical protein
VKRITLNGCVQGRATQLLQSFLSALRLLPVAFNFECVAGTFAGGTQLVQSQLLWCFGFLKLEDSHAFIYGDLHRAISQSNAQQRIYPQPPTPTPKSVTPIEPMTNGYDERDKDELVFHSHAQHPYKTVSQIKSVLSGQKRGF